MTEHPEWEVTSPGDESKEIILELSNFHMLYRLGKPVAAVQQFDPESAQELVNDLLDKIGAA